MHKSAKNLLLMRDDLVTLSGYEHKLGNKSLRSHSVKNLTNTRAHNNEIGQ